MLASSTSRSWLDGVEAPISAGGPCPKRAEKICRASTQRQPVNAFPLSPSFSSSSFPSISGCAENAPPLGQ